MITVKKDSIQKGATTAPKAETKLTIKEAKEILTQKGVEFKGKATLAELTALVEGTKSQKKAKLPAVKAKGEY